MIAFNLTRAAATITGPGLAKATTATIRRKLTPSLPGPRRRPQSHAAPPGGLALEGRLDRAVRPGLRTTTGTEDLTTPAGTGTTTHLEQPGSEARDSPAPSSQRPVRHQPPPLRPGSSVDRGLEVRAS